MRNIQINHKDFYCFDKLHQKTPHVGEQNAGMMMMMTNNKIVWWQATERGGLQIIMHDDLLSVNGSGISCILLQMKVSNLPAECSACHISHPANLLTTIENECFMFLLLLRSLTAVLSIVGCNPWK
ncbi:hypothetical protein NPIL_597411 [Nephila pilipes]|uniref:Uncharacterized protein n=1 Tax=Nephila pilipes TaxID=299642 RepID=A0A8X6Q5Z2_NEPPI|nr:hypothetical protein NPIL_597411 [Nephila pilipes]